jgi:hypothetical protein
MVVPSSACALDIGAAAMTPLPRTTAETTRLRLERRLSSPAFGGCMKSVHVGASRSIKDVRLNGDVAVAADHMGDAKKSLPALTSERDDSPLAQAR